MPMSCKCILDRMVHKGAMTEKERDKILRNLKRKDDQIKSLERTIIMMMESNELIKTRLENMLTEDSQDDQD